MTTQSTRTLKVGIVFMVVPLMLFAQLQRDPVSIQNWPAPLYWQPSPFEEQAKPELFSRLAAVARASDVGVEAQTPANSLVFVGMTPCRVVDTRTGSGFSGAFGPPSLVGGASRTFPIQSSSTCSIPSIAQAYSFNITLVPPGFVDFITVWPTGQPRPTASTLNAYVGTVIANAAIVPAGTGGSVDVYASQSTNLIIDINGYYAAQSGITLAPGTAGAPSLSFAGDPGTGIFSSGTSVDIATGGANRLSVSSNGNVGIGTLAPAHRLSLTGGPAWTSTGWAGALSLSNASAIGWQGNAAGQRFGIGHTSGGLYFFRTASEPGNALSPAIYDMVMHDGGNVTIGTTMDNGGKLQVEGGTGIGVSGLSTSAPGVYGNSTGGTGVYGNSTSGTGVHGNTQSGFGVNGFSASNAGVVGHSTSGTGLVAKTSFGSNLVEGYTLDVRRFHITNNGTYVAGSDFAEALPARGDKAGYEPGDVLVLSTKVLGTVEKTSRIYDERVAGVYSTRPGMLGAEKGGATRVDAEDLPVAIIGVVPTKVSAAGGPIRVGDLLTTSSTPGYAMRCENRVKCFGASLGKAMEPLAEGKGVIKVLVTLR